MRALLLDLMFGLCVVYRSLIEVQYLRSTIVVNYYQQIKKATLGGHKWTETAGGNNINNRNFVQLT